MKRKRFSILGLSAGAWVFGLGLGLTFGYDGPWWLIPFGFVVGLGVDLLVLRHALTDL